jgi:hypothetical protein
MAAAVATASLVADITLEWLLLLQQLAWLVLLQLDLAAVITIA